MNGKTTLRAALVAATLLVGPAFAASDLQVLDQQLGRVASNDFQRPKALCACQDPGPLDGAAGMVVKTNTFPVLGGVLRQILVARCAVSIFDETGSRLDFELCARFTTLSR